MKLCPKCQKQFSDDANFCPVDAARLVPLEGPAVAVEDSISARFEVGAPLGGGRTGTVHRATDKTTGQLAALKIIAPAVVAPRLERELKQLERVHSAGVAKVLASGKRGDDSWVALELLDGAQTLADAIAVRGPIAVDQAAHLVEVIGEALIEAAQVGVVHRDLAPKNVLFAGDDVKLINFSLPVPSDKVAGVPEFVAPEQHDGKPVDQRSNLYSLGALYYYVLTGQPVQHDDTGAVKPPSTLVGVPAGVDAIILRALDRSPTKRFLTVRQFVDEVSRVARGEPDPKAAAPQGRVKPKAELVQTLLGFRSGGVLPPSPPAAVQASASPERSPWAAPAAPAALPAPDDAISTLVDMVPSGAVATPVPTPAPVAAPAAPVVAAHLADKADTKGKFRETMWFKKGELDAEAAAAAEHAASGGDAGADSMPIDERYKDDGTLSRSDKEKYSLRTGGTSSVKALRDGGTGASSKVSEDALISEMRGGRAKLFALVAIGVIALVVIIVLLAR